MLFYSTLILNCIQAGVRQGLDQPSQTRRRAHRAHRELPLNAAVKNYLTIDGARHHATSAAGIQLAE